MKDHAINEETYFKKLEGMFKNVKGMRFVSGLIFDVDHIKSDPQKPFSGFNENRGEIRAFLKFLRRNEVRTAIVCSTPEKDAKEALEKEGLSDYFDEVVQCQEKNEDEPIKDLTYVIADAKLGTRPSETYVLTNSENGVTAACDAGLHAIAMVGRTQSAGIEEMAENMLPSLRLVQRYLGTLLP